MKRGGPKAEYPRLTIGGLSLHCPQCETKLEAFEDRYIFNGRRVQWECPSDDCEYVAPLLAGEPKT